MNDKVHPGDSAEEATAKDGKMSEETGQKWINRIIARRDAFKKSWWKCASQAQEMYDMEKGYDPASQNPFNILYANTEVLLPALYSNTPRPDIRTRFDQEKDQIAQAVERLLVAIVDDNTPGTGTFDDTMTSAVLGALVPGGGFGRLRYYPEAVCPFQFESGHYDQFLWGYATSWAKVPWICFEHALSREAVLEQFGEDGVKPENLKELPKQEDLDAGEKKKEEPTYDVHEVWIKSERKTVFLCDEFETKVLREVDDVLKIENFFPTPGLLALIQKAGSIEPTALYEYYKEQARELNQVTVRLSKVLSAIKVRGVYNTILGKNMETILDQNDGENKLIASDIPFGTDSNGFDKHIWTLPIDKLIIVAQQLYVGRQEILKVIYQITGIADIVRGSSAASETASAQQIKDKWSGVRLRRSQKLVANYARDMLRLVVDAASSVLKPEQWAAITQLDYPTQEEKEAAIAQLRDQAMAAQEQAQQQADPTQPPLPPSEPDPELVEKAEMLSWEEIVSALQSDRVRAYVIDIETNSTIDPDAQIDKQEVAEFLGGMGQLAPMVQLLAQAPGGAEVAKEILIAVSSKFKLGRALTNALQKLQAPQGPEGEQQPPDHSMQVAMIKAQSDMKLAQMQVQADERLTGLQGQIDKMLKVLDIQGKLAVEEKKSQTKLQEKEVDATVDMAMGQQQIQADQQGRREELSFQAQQGEQDRAFQQQDKAEDRSFQARQGDKDRQFQAKQAQQQDKTARYGIDTQAKAKAQVAKSKPPAGKSRR